MREEVSVPTSAVSDAESTGSPSSPARRAGGTEGITVAVHTEDETLASGLFPTLSNAVELQLLPPDLACEAEVALVLAGTVTDATVNALSQISGNAENPAQRTVLVCGPLMERHLTQIFRSGVVSILPRHGITARQVTRAIFATQSGHAMVPDKMTRWLIDELGRAQNNLLATQGLASGGLTVREVEVLKLIAQGEDTSSVAAQLSYSERTIKKIVQEMMSRLNLRNRAHAVSYALKVGAI